MDRDDIFNTEKNTIYQKGFTPSRNRDWGIEKKKPDQSRIILASVIIIIVVSAGAALIDFDDPRLHEPDRIFRFFEQFSLPSFSVDIFSQVWKQNRLSRIVCPYTYPSRSFTSALLSPLSQ